ncbi:Tetratricopeptide repeat protein 36-like protein [Aphelenchoides fujianensis]|nr:Tetratricopeptide repeat protein 36-like protein [Aphelenchoides fujianensis]
MATKRDRNVLNMILNPLMPTEDAAANESDGGDREKTGGGRWVLIESVGDDSSSADYSALEGFERSRQLEVEGIRLSEARDHEAAVAKFDEAIRSCPRNPSAYNNRAQEKQLLKRVDEAKQDLEAGDRAERRSWTCRLPGVHPARPHPPLEGNMEAAKADYEKAAELGSKFAKMELVSLNPFAAMCNQMLHDVMQKLRSGEEDRNE